jgi:hypothetical protein
MSMLDRNYSFYTLTDNTAGSVAIPVSASPVPLAFVSITVDIGDTVVLKACAGWEAITDCAGLKRTDIMFSIWRDAHLTGKMVCSVLDSGECHYDKYKVTSFVYADSGFTSRLSTTYTLIAEVPLPDGIIHITGCLSFMCLKMNKYVKMEGK